MLILRIYGVPHKNSEVPTSFEEEMVKLVEKIGEAVLREFKILEHDLSVFFPADLMQKGLGEELVCFVDGFSTRPALDLAIRRKMSEIICAELAIFARECVPNCLGVQVYVRPLPAPDRDVMSMETF